MKYKYLNNLKLKKNINKLVLILNIYLEKQFIFFVYFYLFFFQCISKIFTKYAINLNISFFRKFLIKFFDNFTFSLFFFFKNVNLYSISLRKLKYFFFVLKDKKINLNIKENIKINFKNKKELKIYNKNNKIINNFIYKKETKLDLNKFYLKKIFKISLFSHNSVFFTNRFKIKQLKIFNTFSIFMFRFLKFKLIFTLFFKLNYLCKNKFKFISFLGIKRFKNSIIASNLYLYNFNKLKYNFLFFYYKYNKKIKILTTFQNNTSNKIPGFTQFKNDLYFLTRISNKIYKKKYLYLISIGRNLIYRFSNYLNLPLIFKYTKYQYFNKKYFKSYMKYNLKINCFNNYPKTKILHRSEYKKSYHIRSCNYYIKKPLQKLIISGKKKSGYNIFNNLFFSMHKLYRRSMKKHIEIINNIFKSVFIRATIKNQERNKSKIGVRQTCTLLVGFEELRSRTNIFFYDFTQSLIRKKNRKFRVRKVKDLIFSNFFNCTIKKKGRRRKNNTHLMRTFYEIYDLMFKELRFRNKNIFKINKNRPIIVKVSKKFKKFKRIDYRFKTYKYFQKRKIRNIKRELFYLNIVKKFQLTKNISEINFSELIKNLQLKSKKKLKNNKFKLINNLSNFFFLNKNKFKKLKISKILIFNIFKKIIKDIIYFSKNIFKIKHNYKYKNNFKLNIIKKKTTVNEKFLFNKFIISIIKEDSNNRKRDSIKIKKKLDPNSYRRKLYLSWPKERQVENFYNFKKNFYKNKIKKIKKNLKKIGKLFNRRFCYKESNKYNKNKYSIYNKLILLNIIKKEIKKNKKKK